MHDNLHAARMGRRRLFWAVEGQRRLRQVGRRDGQPTHQAAVARPFVIIGIDRQQRADALVQLVRGRQMDGVFGFERPAFFERAAHEATRIVVERHRSVYETQVGRSE